jgi:hypothetical protein
LLWTQVATCDSINLGFAQIWILVQKGQAQDHHFYAVDAGCLIVDAACSMLDVGYSGMYRW